MQPPPTELPPDLERTSGQPKAAGETRSTWSVGMAWVAILGTVVFLMILHRLPEADEVNALPMAPFEIHAKLLVGLTAGIGSKQDFEKNISQAFGRGPASQQLIGVILMGELSGPKSAMKSLQELETRIDEGPDHASPTDQQIVSFLKKIQQARIDNKDFLTEFSRAELEDGRKLLRARFGWVGRLATHPPEISDQKTRSELLADARRTAFTAIGAIALGMCATFCGVILQVVFWAFVLSGRFTSTIGPSHASHAVYAETFAVWMLMFILLSRIFSFPVFAPLGFSAILIPQIGSLAALAWPVVRGVNWKDTRLDLGLFLGPQRWSIPLVGIATYLSALPAVLVALVITVALMSLSIRLGLTDDQSAPVHPIVEPMLRGSWWVRLQIVLIAVFAAIPEEIMFRGVLYRHLRQASQRWAQVPASGSRH